MFYSISQIKTYLLVTLGLFVLLPNPLLADAWLNDDPNAIWGKSPGFYKEGNDWVAIVHTHSSVNNVQLVGDFTQGDTHAINLTKTPDGKFWWFKGTDSSFHSVPQSGDNYKFKINGTKRQDPAARWVEHTGLGGNSKVHLSDSFTWTDSGWNPPGWDYYIIYQLHPRRFTKRNTHLSYLQRITEELNNNGTDDYINDLGVTAIALLPINAFATDTSWGYNPSFFYAVEDSYGTPDQLKELVNTAHAQGIAVIFDLVYNHGGNGDNVLNQYNHSTYYDGDTDWGPLVNYDNDVARHFFVQNAKYLAQEYHVDGFRFDHTRSIHDTWGSSHVKWGQKGSGGGWNFLREIRHNVKSVNAGIILIAEELPDNWWVTKENVGDNWGGDWHAPFDSQWADYFRDNFYDVLSGAHLNGLFSVFRNFGDSWHDPLIYVESHDEVGNEDKRVAKTGRDIKGWEMCQISATGTILGKGIPMYFMGHESGEDQQFHKDWWQDWAVLDIDEYESNIGKSKVRSWFRKMADIRKGDFLKFAHGNINITHLHDDNGVVAFSRDNGKYVVVLNFKGTDRWNYGIGVSGNYQEIANTSWPQYRLATGNPEVSRGGSTAQWINSVHIPKYGAVVLVRWD